MHDIEGTYRPITSNNFNLEPHNVELTFCWCRYNIHVLIAGNTAAKKVTDGIAEVLKAQMSTRFSKAQSKITSNTSDIMFFVKTEIPQHLLTLNHLAIVSAKLNSVYHTVSAISGINYEAYYGTNTTINFQLKIKTLKPTNHWS